MIPSQRLLNLNLSPTILHPRAKLSRRRATSRVQKRRIRSARTTTERILTATKKRPRKMEHLLRWST